MPYLTQPIGEFGAIVEIKVGVIELRRRMLLKHSFPVPERVKLHALIDSGASLSSVHGGALESLDITPTGKTDVLVPSVSREPCEFEEFAVSITLVGPNGIELYLPTVARVLKCHFHEHEPYQALLGRDVLDHCLFIYDGVNKTFSFAF